MFRLSLLSCSMALLLLISPLAGVRGTEVEITPTFPGEPTDLLSLPGDGTPRTLIFDLGGYTANEAELVFASANRDTLFREFGESVEGGAIRIKVGVFSNLLSGLIVHPFFRQEQFRFSLLQLGGQLPIQFRSTGPDALLIGDVRLHLYDTIPPGRVGDLAVASSAPHALRLEWTAPGDDGALGRAAAYDLRYSMVPVDADTVAWFENANPAEGVPEPGSPGSLEVFYLSGLELETTYSVLLRTEDEFGNWSGFSNPAEGTTTEDGAGTALQFDGHDDLAKLPDHLAIIEDDFTIEMWLYIHEIGPNDNQTLLDMRSKAYGEGDNRNAGLYVGIRIDQEPYISFITVDDFYYNHVVMAPGTATQGRWHHLAFTRDGEVLTGYWNGQPVVENPSVNPGPIRFRGDYPGTHLGRGWPTTPDWGFDGILEEIRIWSVARTEEEIQEAMHRTISPQEPGLAGYWPMDDAAGQIIRDYGPLDNDGLRGETDEVEAADPLWIDSNAPIGRRTSVPGASREAGTVGLLARLGANPNPFGEKTSISFRLEQPERVSLRIFDVQGRAVRRLLESTSKPAGVHAVDWRGLDDRGHPVGAGMYYYTVRGQTVSQSGRVTVLR